MKIDISKERYDEIVSRSAKFERSRPTLVLSMGDKQIVMHVPTRVCAFRVLTYFSKEPETIDWIATVPKGGVMFDVGANVGLYTVLAAVTRSAKVYAFEPEATNFAVLNDNLRSNKLTETCRPYCVGISDELGFGTMFIRGEGAGHSGHQVQVTRSGSFTMNDRHSYQGIAAVPLDYLVYDQGFECPSHLKVDVDGIEHAVINGARKLIADPRLKSIMIELMVKHDVHQKVINTLVDAGFQKDAAMEAAVHAKTEGGTAYIGNILFTRA